MSESIKVLGVTLVQQYEGCDVWLARSGPLEVMAIHDRGGWPQFAWQVSVTDLEGGPSILCRGDTLEAAETKARLSLAGTVERFSSLLKDEGGE